MNRSSVLTFVHAGKVYYLVTEIDMERLDLEKSDGYPGGVRVCNMVSLQRVVEDHEDDSTSTVQMVKTMNSDATDHKALPISEMF